MGLFQTNNWELCFTYGLADFFVMALVVLLTSTVYTRETGFNAILLTTKNGLRQTFLAKALATTVLAFVLSLLYSLAILFFFHFRYDLAGLSKPVFTVASMAQSYLSMTIGQYTLLFIATKALGAALLALICCSISALSRSNLFAFAFCVIFLGASYQYSVLFDKPQVREIFKMLDITLWFKPNRYFSGYFTTNILEYPVLWVAVRLFCWLLLAVALVILGCWLAKPQVTEMVDVEAV
jgi:hypothetical protein